MKIGVHMSMFCKNWDDDIIPFLEPLKEIGYDGVEVSLFGADRSSLGMVGKAIKNLDLEVNCGIGINSDTDISSHDKSVRDNGILFLKKCIDKTNEIGSKSLSGVITAPWQEFAMGCSRKERWKRSAEGIKIIGEYAQSAGVNINLEVLNRFESDFMNTLGEGSDFLELVGLDNVKLLADTFHMNIEENEIEQALQDNIKNIGYIHLCENHRGVPGTGHILWNNIFETLKANNYNEWITIESFVSSQGEVADGLSIWRDLGEPMVEAKRGFDYINKCVNKYKY